MTKKKEKNIMTIEDYLLSKGEASVMELSQLVDVSPEMTRKYLTFLEEKGFLFRKHGGAILRNSSTDIPLSIRLKEKTEIKKKLSLAALDFIHDDDCVFIDPSSTLLSLGLFCKTKKNLIIVTNCFGLLNTLKGSKNNKVFFLGGKFSESGNRTEGQYQLSMINSFNFDVSFFGTDGLYGLDGPGTESNDAVFLNENVIKNSKKSILVTDSSKFYNTPKFKYANFDCFDTFITNEIPADFKEVIKVSNIIETD